MSLQSWLRKVRERADRATPNGIANANLIAHARTDLPTAIKVIEVLLRQRNDHRALLLELLEGMGAKATELEHPDAELLEIVRGEK